MFTGYPISWIRLRKNFFRDLCFDNCLNKKNSIQQLYLYLKYWNWNVLMACKWCLTSCSIESERRSKIRKTNLSKSFSSPKEFPAPSVLRIRPSRPRKNNGLDKTKHDHINDRRKTCIQFNKEKSEEKDVLSWLKVAGICWHAWFIPCIDLASSLAPHCTIVVSCVQKQS